jgi:hypothetical protein
MSRRTFSSLHTSLAFEVLHPADYPRALDAYLLHDCSDAPHLALAIRPDPRSGLWRVERVGGCWVEAVDGLEDLFAGPEHAAFAIEGWLARGRRRPTDREGLALLGGAVADAARLVMGGAAEMVTGGDPVSIRATF